MPRLVGWGAFEGFTPRALTREELQELVRTFPDKDPAELAGTIMLQKQDDGPGAREEKSRGDSMDGEKVEDSGEDEPDAAAGATRKRDLESFQEDTEQPDRHEQGFEKHLGASTAPSTSIPNPNSMFLSAPTAAPAPEPMSREGNEAALHEAIDSLMRQTAALRERFGVQVSVNPNFGTAQPSAPPLPPPNDNGAVAENPFNPWTQKNEYLTWNRENRPSDDHVYLVGQQQPQQQGYLPVQAAAMGQGVPFLGQGGSMHQGEQYMMTAAGNRAAGDVEGQEQDTGLPDEEYSSSDESTSDNEGDQNTNTAAHRTGPSWSWSGPPGLAPLAVHPASGLGFSPVNTSSAPSAPLFPAPPSAPTAVCTNPPAPGANIFPTLNQPVGPGIQNAPCQPYLLPAPTPPTVGVFNPTTFTAPQPPQQQQQQQQQPFLTFLPSSSFSSSTTTTTTAPAPAPHPVQYYNPFRPQTTTPFRTTASPEPIDHLCANTVRMARDAGDEPEAIATWLPSLRALLRDPSTSAYYRAHAAERLARVGWPMVPDAASRATEAWDLCMELRVRHNHGGASGVTPGTASSLPGDMAARLDAVQISSLESMGLFTAALNAEYLAACAEAEAEAAEDGGVVGAGGTWVDANEVIVGAMERRCEMAAAEGTLFARPPRAALKDGARELWGAAGPGFRKPFLDAFRESMVGKDLDAVRRHMVAKVEASTGRDLYS